LSTALRIQGGCGVECEKCSYYIRIVNAYPKVKNVEPLSDKRLLVAFTTGDSKVYDCTPLLNSPPFAPLKDAAFFKNVHADPHGHGIIWNDDVDLSESELWINGTTQ
jgi:hypothetical protein